jgi:hypothetical protein
VRDGRFVQPTRRFVATNVTNAMGWRHHLREIQPLVFVAIGAEREVSWATFWARRLRVGTVDANLSQGAASGVARDQR